MKKINGFFILIILMSCNSTKEKLVYQDSSNKYYAKIEESNSGGSPDTIYTLYDFSEPSKLKEAGHIMDGLRNDVWTYTSNDGVKQVKWGHFKDKYLNYETNIFSYADSAKYFDTYTKLLFSTENDKVILTISINNPSKDSLTSQNFKEFVEDEYSKA